MLLQIKNRVFLLEAISYASISYPCDTRQGRPIELMIVIDGHPVTLAGEEASALWTAIAKNAISLQPNEYSATAPNSVRRM